MGAIARLIEWMTVPAVETTTYRCLECHEVFDVAETECPACGEDVEELVHQPVELYWPHY